MSLEPIQTHVTWPTNAGGFYLDNQEAVVTWTLTQRMSLGQLIQAHVTWATNPGGCYLDN